jgi:hypothetical protein
LVPENLTKCLQIFKPDGEKVLTAEQIKDLHEEHRTGSTLYFVMELINYPKAGNWPIFQLSFSNCQGEDLGSHIIFCPPISLPINGPNNVGSAFCREVQRGTLLSNVTRVVYQCDPGMFHKYWKEIAGSHAWQYMFDDIGRIEANASQMKRNCGEQLLYDLAEHRPDLTVEKITAVISCMGYKSFTDVIRQRTLEAGWPFDDDLYRDLIKDQTLYSNDQYTECYTSDARVSMDPVPDSPPQSMIHTHCSFSTCDDYRRQTVSPVPTESHPTRLQSRPLERSSDMEMVPLPLMNSHPFVSRPNTHREICPSRRVDSQLNIDLHLHLSMEIDDEALTSF